MLSLGECGYGAVVRAKNRRFDSGRTPATKVDATVISVGNLTVGGTGKTPMVSWLARWFDERGAEVTLISRGYGAKAGQPNDEARELAARLPGICHLQHPDRIAAARIAVTMSSRKGRPVLILDDAFQHRRIARDLDIVLLDALQPFGFEHLLPRGLLREPPESLSRAHVVALSRADAISADERATIRARVEKLAPQALWIELEHRPSGYRSAAGVQIGLNELRGKRIAAFCGIGNPAGFRHTLGTCGIEVVELREFPDHFAYAAQSLAELDTWAARQAGVEAIVCTHKDLVKIPRETLGGRPLWALAIDVEIRAGREAFETMLAQKQGESIS
jgi:tetraacyldisaccharide 4'-kinase